LQTAAGIVHKQIEEKAEAQPSQTKARGKQP
jgi:hypothetical protein